MEDLYEIQIILAFGYLTWVYRRFPGRYSYFAFEPGLMPCSLSILAVRLFFVPGSPSAVLVVFEQPVITSDPARMPRQRTRQVAEEAREFVEFFFTWQSPERAKECPIAESGRHHG
jgi:hypothetical protein